MIKDMYELVKGNGDYGSFFAVEVVMFSESKELLLSYVKKKEYDFSEEIKAGSLKYHIMKSNIKMLTKE
jgi:hypothetical protein